MNRQGWKVISLSFGLVVLWALAAFAQADVQKITVRASGATIHAGPNAESQVIESPAVGSVYEVVRKTGEWYEIKIPSRLGMTITGFINEKFLRAEEKPAAEQEKEVVQTPSKEEAEPAWHPKGAKRGHISIGGFFQRQAGYEYEWGDIDSYYLFDSADDHNAFGLHLGAGYFVKENVLELDAGLDIAFATLDGWFAIATPDDAAEVELEHKFTSLMIYLGVNYYFLEESRVGPYVGGGASFLRGSVDMMEEEYTITANTLGFFGKAGVDIPVTEPVAFFVEGRYVLAIKSEITHPMLEDSDGEGVEIDLGGFSAIGGIKIWF